MVHFLDNEVNEFLQGYKRTIALEKEKGNIPLHEGKRPLYFESYRKVASYSMKSGYCTSQYLTNPLFIALCCSRFFLRIGPGAT